MIFIVKITMQVLECDMESTGLTLREAMDLTKDRGQWRSFIRTHHRQMAVSGAAAAADDDDEDDDDNDDDCIRFEMIH